MDTHNLPPCIPVIIVVALIITEYVGYMIYFIWSLYLLVKNNSI